MFGLDDFGGKGQGLGFNTQKMKFDFPQVQAAPQQQQTDIDPAALNEVRLQIMDTIIRLNGRIANMETDNER